MTIKLSKYSDKPEGTKVCTHKLGPGRGMYELWRLGDNENPSGTGGTLYFVATETDGSLSYCTMGGVFDADPDNMPFLVDAAEEEMRALTAELG